MCHLDSSGLFYSVIGSSKFLAEINFMQPKESAEHHQTILLLDGSWGWCNLIPKCSEKWERGQLGTTLIYSNS